jgi:hypothetical protein
VEQYFRTLRVDDDTTRIEFTATLLKEHAALWYRLQCLRHDGHPYATWDEFRTALKQTFTPVNQEKRARDRLASLRQTTSAQRYIQEFTSLCLEISDLHSTEQLDRFVRGLKPHVRREVELRDPKTFDEATTIAERVDQISFAATRTKPIQGSRPSTSSGPQPMELGAMRTVPTVKKTRLTPEERQDLRQRKACFYCRESGHMMADCPNKPKNFNKPGNGQRRPPSNRW